MREILFRGKCIRTNEWVYGSLLQEMYNCYISRKVDQTREAITQICVHKETIGQFTGLLDKNGVKIFEGDLLNIFLGVGLGDTAEVITYSEKYGYYKYGNNPICEILEDEKVSYLVIGNIHDND